MDSTLKQTYKTTKLLYCIYHISQNFLKNLKAKLGVAYGQFINNFYRCCNTLDDTLFESRWQSLLLKFSSTTLSSCIEIASVGSKVFLTINHIISEYLTSYILSAKHVEIAQCLYFDATLMNLEGINSYNEDESIGNHFIEDVYNARQILVKSIIAKVAEFHIKIIASRWCYNFKREASEQLNVIFANENAIRVQQNQIIPTIPQPLSVSCLVTANNWSNNKEDDKLTNEPNDSEEEDNSMIINLLVTKRKSRCETK
ncbi:22871_t:CDS:2 [Dentiscutata erythropus]|uniref:22871_t:CDS:1 n=1 Tax=Dentiscutata erythropus TaxID=1348616 RepID=A0A9N9NFD0_9GLOM|nr:22871_t:CDS:2 [Dentiscutata erythropus]